MSLIDPCSDILMDLSWDETSDDEKEARIRDWVDQLLEDWGVEGVSVQFGEPTDGAPGDYDFEEKTITLDPNLLDGDTQHLMDVAAHEVGHAIQDDYLGGHMENQNPNPDDPYTTEQVDANEFAAAVRDDVAGDCMDPESDSASKQNAPLGDWNLPAGDSGYA
jgi:putative neutral zinc metallopeptidase